MDKELPVSAWPEWKIIEKIGEGSFGKVYRHREQNVENLSIQPLRSSTYPEARAS